MQNKIEKYAPLEQIISDCDELSFILMQKNYYHRLVVTKKDLQVFRQLLTALDDFSELIQNKILNDIHTRMKQYDNEHISSDQQESLSQNNSSQRTASTANVQQTHSSRSNTMHQTCP